MATPLSRDQSLELTERRNDTVQDGSQSSPPTSPLLRRHTSFRYPKDIGTHGAILKPFSSDKARLCHSIFGKVWLKELLAHCFSMLCMGAVIGFLLYEDNKPLDSWGFRISPTAVASFLVTLAKSAFLLAITETISQLKWLHFHDKSHKISDLNLFDSASRGPLRSFKLLVTGYKYALLASGAASIILAALFVDPFVQLAFSFPLRRTLVPASEASFQVAEVYDPNHYEWDPYFTASRANSVNTAMQAAILDGLYVGRPSPLFSCPTTNCTWSDVNTLGVCSNCQDITLEIQTHCPTRPAEINSQDYECHYTMPGGDTLRGYLELDEHGIYNIQTRWNSSTYYTDAAYSMSSQNPSTSIIRFEGVQVPLAYGNNTLPLPSGTRCSFNFCAKNYAQVNVTNGVPHISASKDYPLMLNNVSNDGIKDFLNFNTNPSGTTDGKITTYSINPADYANIQDYLNQLFSTGWTITHSTRYSYVDYTLITAPDAGRKLAEAKDLDSLMRSVADSMTEEIRTGPNSTIQVGQSYVEKTFIEIRWAYLAYPITIILLTLVVLVSVILETNKRNIVAWKSSSLALLFHELDGWDMPAGNIRDGQELETMAKKMKGKLFEESDHLKFVKAD